MAAHVTMHTTQCSSFLGDLLFKPNHPTADALFQFAYRGHLWVRVGYVQEDYYARLERSKSTDGGGFPIMHEQPAHEFTQAVALHDQLIHEQPDDHEFTHILAVHHFARCPFVEHGPTGTSRSAIGDGATDVSHYVTGTEEDEHTDHSGTSRSAIGDGATDVSHYVTGTEEDEHTDHLPLQRLQTQGSHRSLWVSAAVVIGALFAIAMVARFGGGMGMSTSGANIFVGVTGAALGTYTFCALPSALLIDRSRAQKFTTTGL